MRFPLRVAAGTLAFTLVYGGFAVACPQWTRDLGLDVWNIGRENEEIDSQKRKMDELEILNQRVRHRLHIKMSMIRDVIEDRLSLAETTDQFTKLNEIEPELMTYTRMNFAGETDQEKVANQVIQFTHAQLQEDPSRREIIERRLKEERDVMLGRGKRSTVH